MIVRRLAASTSDELSACTRGWQQRNWIFQRRRDQGEIDNLLEEMRMQDAESHFRCIRKSAEIFDDQMPRVASALSLLRRRSISNVHRSARDLTRKRYKYRYYKAMGEQVLTKPPTGIYRMLEAVALVISDNNLC
ncbi:uncharacterized protein LOC134196098 [Corticium candelabrum]|uniref:uncharacterized protein LOC134196098 n=1 Tax=Corticium candelabrum TaxID=121492 RepID=UPI002E252247|nr:uncharacterized protein LOC134196098 [Corticium candelabrum]